MVLGVLDEGPQLHRPIRHLELVESAPHVGRHEAEQAYERHDTTVPPLPPPVLLCPSCDQPLQYVRSHVGGVSAQHSEQWDYYDCTAMCGTFQYRQRTRKLRQV